MLAIERVPAARYIKFMSVARGSSPRRDPRVKYEGGSGEEDLERGRKPRWDVRARSSRVALEGRAKVMPSGRTGFVMSCRALYARTSVRVYNGQSN